MAVKLIPDENIYILMADFFKTSVEELKFLLDKTEIIDNLEGIIVDNYYTSVNKQIYMKYYYEDKFIDQAGIDTNIYEEINDDIYIRGFPITKNQYTIIRKQLQEFNSWARLPADVFYKLVQDNNINGRDLLSLCNANPKINDLCNSKNQTLFKRLLVEGRLDLTKQSNSVSYRELYANLFRNELHIAGFNMDIHNYIDESLKLKYETFKFTTVDFCRMIAARLNHYAYIDKNKYVWTAGIINGANDTLTKLGRNIAPESVSTLPGRIDGDIKANQVACGSYHTMVLDIIGQIWAFGSNLHGQLGLTNLEPRDSNVKIPTMIPNFVSVKQISCGYDHSAFIDVDGKIWTFGRNNFGQLGISDNISRNTPTLIEGYNDCKQVACGTKYTAFIEKNNSLITCGNNIYGQLGHNNSILSRAENLPKIIKVACGADHTVCLDMQGQIWGFGSNRKRQLGLDLNIIQQSTIPLLISSFKEIREIACGMKSTAFITKNNVLYLCGYDVPLENGVIGVYGTFIEQRIFVQQVALGKNFTLFLA